MNSSTPFRTAAMAALAVVSADNFVSVCRDATYKLPSSRGPICSGAGSAPTGSACPLVGDVASGDCYAYLPSYEGAQCTAKESAVCTIVNGDTWGCVFPSVGCGDSAATPCPITALPDTNMSGKAPGWPFATGEVDDSQDIKMPNASDHSQGLIVPKVDMIGAGTTPDTGSTTMNPTDVSPGAEVNPTNPTDVSPGAEVNPTNPTDVSPGAEVNPTNPTDVSQGAEVNPTNPTNVSQGAALNAMDPAMGGTGPAIPPPTNLMDGNTDGMTTGPTNPTESDGNAAPRLANAEETNEAATASATGTMTGDAQNGTAPASVPAPVTQ